MNIIKEVLGKTAIVRTRTYAESLAYFDELFAEAQKDFPALMRSDVSVKHYGGDSIKGTYGIEFTIPANLTVPATYEPIARVYPTL